MSLSKAPGTWRWELRKGMWWHINDHLGIEDGPHARAVEGLPLPSTNYSANQQALDELVMRSLDVAASQTYVRYHPEQLGEVAELKTKLKALDAAVDVYVRARPANGRPSPLVPERAPTNGGSSTSPGALR